MPCHRAAWWRGPHGKELRPANSHIGKLEGGWLSPLPGGSFDLLAAPDHSSTADPEPETPQRS